MPRIGRKRKFSSPLSLSLFLWFWGLFFFGFASFLVFWFCFKRQTTFPAGSFVCVCVCVCLCVLDEGPVRWTSGARSPANESLPLFFPFRSVPPGPSPPFSFNSSPSVSLTNDNEERNNRTIVWIQNAVTNSIRCRNCISHRRPSWLGLATHRTGHLIGCRLLAGFLQIPSINPCSDVFFFVCFFFLPSPHSLPIKVGEQRPSWRTQPITVERLSRWTRLHFEIFSNADIDSCRLDVFRYILYSKKNLLFV